MNQRERWIAALTFGSPDKIPFTPGSARESTLRRWHRQGLPEGVDYHRYLQEQLGMEVQPSPEKVPPGVDFRMIPRFEEKILAHRAGHYLVQDWKGNICEISDRYDPSYLSQAKDFVTRKWLKCPVECRADWEEMKGRYSVDAPGRFPDDFLRRCERLSGRDYFVQVNFPGPFWQLREWCGFEGLCMMMIEEPELVAEMAAFWENFVSQVLERVFDGFTPDCVRFDEDMAYKHKAMISPAMVRRYCQPSWESWTRRAKGAGVPLVGIDSDGYIGELIPLWIESGVNCCVPVEVAAGCDIREFRERFGRRMAYQGGVDKRCIAAGGDAVRAELRRIGPVIGDGGYVPGCDHGVPPDISWPNFVEYARLLAEMTGWL